MERKVYYSFHDIPFSSHSTPKPPLTSKTEILHLLVSMAILSTAFAFSMSGGLIGLIRIKDPIGVLIYSLKFSIIGILTGFFFHELSHKLTARRFGLWAEYRMFPAGLLFALILGIFFGFVVAAPGVVNVWGGARRFEFGRIALAGPLANLVIGTLALVGYLHVGIDTLHGSILGFVAMINIFLAFFNLLPFGPLDGKKVIAWNSVVWAVVIFYSFALLMFSLGRIFIPYPKV